MGKKLELLFKLSFLPYVSFPAILFSHAVFKGIEGMYWIDFEFGLLVFNTNIWWNFNVVLPTYAPFLLIFTAFQITYIIILTIKRKKKVAALTMPEDDAPAK